MSFSGISFFFTDDFLSDELAPTLMEEAIKLRRDVLQK
jgi:hypothetical protein